MPPDVKFLTGFSLNTGFAYKEEETMLNRVCITPQKGCQGLTNARLKSAFKNVFSEDPVMIRSEGKRIIVHTPLELKEKKVRKFAGKLGSFTIFKGEVNSFSFRL